MKTRTVEGPTCSSCPFRHERQSREAVYDEDQFCTLSKQYILYQPDCEVTMVGRPAPGWCELPVTVERKRKQDADDND